MPPSSSTSAVPPPPPPPHPPPRRSWGSWNSNNQQAYHSYSTPNSHLLETLLETSLCDNESSASNTGVEVNISTNTNNDMDINESSSVISELTVEPLANATLKLQAVIDVVTSKMSPMEIKEELWNLQLQTNEKEIILQSKMETLIDMKQKIEKDMNDIQRKQDNLEQMKLVVQEVERKFVDLLVEPKDGEIEI